MMPWIQAGTLYMVMQCFPTTPYCLPPTSIWHTDLQSCEQEKRRLNNFMIHVKGALPNQHLSCVMRNPTWMQAD